MLRELRALGASMDVARQVAGNARRWWRTSAKLAQTRLTIAHFDSLEFPDSRDLNFTNRPVRTRTPGGVAGA